MNHIPSSSSKTHARRFAVVFMCTSVLSLMLSYVAFGPGRSMSPLSFSPLTSEAPYGQTGQTASVAQGILLAQAPAATPASATPAGDSSTSAGIGDPSTPPGAPASAPSTPPGAGPANTPAGSGTDAPAPTSQQPTQKQAPKQSSGQDNRQAGVLKNPIGTKNGTLGELLDMLLSTLLMIGSIVIVCAIILAGFKYITAQGDTKQIEAAHQQLFWTAIGAAILLGARIIAKVIENTVRALSS